MKVLLSTLNAKYIHSSLALRYLKAYWHSFEAKSSSSAKVEVMIKEYSINNHLLDILSDVYPLRPDVIGLACYIWNIEQTLKLASFFKKTMPEVKIVLGGPEVSYGFHFDNHYVDYVILGEGEKTFAALITALRNSKHSQCSLKPADIPAIPGLLKCQDNQESKEAALQIIENLDCLAFAYSDDDMESIRDKIIYYETSRGCPFSCQYCLSGRNGKVRFFSKERILRDLAFFIRHKVAQVKFVDRTFNAVKKHYLPILQFLAAQNCQTNFHFEAAAELWDEDGLNILKNAPPGRFQLEIGVQSTHPPTLQTVSRHNDFSAITSNVQTIAAGGNIHLHLDLIVGLPYEGMDSFSKSFNDVYALTPDMLQIGFLKLLKGSPLREKTQEHGYIFADNAPYEVLSNNYLTYEEIRKLKLMEKVFNLVYNSSRFRYTLKWLVPEYLSAFSFYEQLAVFWERQGFELASHNPVTLYKFMSDFSQQYWPQFTHLQSEFLKFDYLLSQKWFNLPDFLFCNNARNSQTDDSGRTRGEKEASFWKNTSLVRQYLPNFSFSSWRNIKKNYHIEIFANDIEAFVQYGKRTENNPSTILFFVENDGKVKFQKIREL